MHAPMQVMQEMTNIVREANWPCMMTQTFLFVAAKWSCQSTLRPTHNLGKGEKSQCLSQMDYIHYQQPILNHTQKDISFWGQHLHLTRLKVDGAIKLDNVQGSHPFSLQPRYIVGLCFLWDLNTDLFTKGDPTRSTRQPTTLELTSPSTMARYIANIGDRGERLGERDLSLFV